MRRFMIQAGKRLLRAVGDFQSRHSLVATTPFLPNDTFAWVPDLAAAYAPIRRELDHLLQHPEDIPAFHQLSPDQAKISKGDNWKTFAFFVFGQKLKDNCALCPDTTAVLERIPTLQNAWFSILAPGYHIPPHKGPTRAVVRVHLGLRVPGQPDRCWIRVADETYSWHEGEVVLFDDTYDHEVFNQTDDLRAVLFLDVDRPMDRVGRWVNAVLLALIRSSAYVRDPLRNLAAWNRQREQIRAAGGEPAPQPIDTGSAAAPRNRTGAD